MRWIVADDIQQVLDIEAELYSDPLSEYDLRELLSRRTVAGKVAEDLYGDVAGFIVYETKAICYEIMRLSISSQCLRQGYGTCIIKDLKKRLSTRRPSIGIQVQERSLPMQLFLRAMGFLHCGTRHGAGNDGDDIYLFEFTRPS